MNYERLAQKLGDNEGRSLPDLRRLASILTDRAGDQAPIILDNILMECTRSSNPISSLKVCANIYNLAMYNPNHTPLKDGDVYTLTGEWIRLSREERPRHVSPGEIREYASEILLTGRRHRETDTLRTGSSSTITQHPHRSTIGVLSSDINYNGRDSGRQ